MGHDPARAVTVGALALLLVATASLFPAGGFGSYPGADRAGATDGTTGTGLAPLDGATETAGGAGESATATATATPTPTPTPEPDDDDESNYADSSPDGGTGLGVLLLWVGGLGAVAFVTAVGVSAAGTVAGAAALPDGRLPRVRLFVAAVPRATVAVLLGTGGVAASLGGGVAQLIGSVGTASLGGVATFGRGVAAAIGGVAAGVASLSLPSLSLSGLIGGLSVSTSSNGSNVTTDTSDTTTRTGGRVRPSTDDDGPQPPATVREAWARFPGYVPGVGRVETRTPGELARAAVAAGRPAEAVETLTGAFRRVRYAGGVDDETRTAALSAFDQLRDDDSGNETGGDEAGGGTDADGTDADGTDADDTEDTSGSHGDGGGDR